MKDYSNFNYYNFNYYNFNYYNNNIILDIDDAPWP